MNPGSGAIDRARRGGLALVMVGALSVSVRGQVQAVGPLLGGMSVVLALTNDLAALLALNELMSTPRRAVRRWAWAVLVLASGTAAGLNTWHALQAGTLPPLWAVVVGIGPVLLAVVLSHLVALVLSDEPEQPGVDDAVEAAATTRAPTPAATSGTASVERPSPTPAGASSVELSRAAAQVPVAAVRGPGVHHPGVHPGLAVVPTRPERAAGPPAVAGGGSPAGGPRAASGTDRRVERLVAQLRAGVALTGVTAAEQLGCSPRTGRRLLRQAEEHLGSTAATAAPSAEDAGRGDVRTATQDGMSADQGQAV